MIALRISASHHRGVIVRSLAVGLGIRAALLGGAASQAGEAGRGTHRALIVDWQTPPNDHWGVPNAIAIVDLDTGGLIAAAEIGRDPDVALSTDGATIAVVSRFKGGDRLERYERLQLFSATDLSAIAEGYLPFADRLLNQRTIGVNVVAFADENRVLLVPRRITKNGQRSVSMWTPIDLKASQTKFAQRKSPRNDYLVSTKYKNVHGGSGVRFPILSTRRWPLVDIGFRGPGNISSLNFVEGTEDDSKTLATMRRSDPNPAKVEAGGTAKTSGILVPTNEGRQAFFAAESEKPSPLRRIAFAKDGPVIEKTGASTPADLYPSTFAASEQAGRVAVTCRSSDKVPTEFRVYDADTLREVGMVDAETEVAQLAFSMDGTRIYAIGKAGIKVYSTNDLSLAATYEGLFKQCAAFVSLP